MTKQLATIFFAIIVASSAFAADDLKGAFKEGALHGEFRNY